MLDTVLDVAQQLRQARLDAGVSQASLARRAGTSQAAISRIERGLEQPGPSRVSALLASLGLRGVLELEAIAEHEAEPRRLAEQSRKSHQQRYEEALSWGRFVCELEATGERAHRG